MLYCGMDLHAKESFVHVIDSKGNRVLARRLPTDPKAFEEVLGPLVRRKVRVILEASTMSRWAAAELKELKMEVVVVDPRRVRLIAETRRKSDRADARVLAELARTGALPPPLNLLSDAARQLQAQLGVRRGLIRQRTATVCQAHALLRSVGIRLNRRGLYRADQWDAVLSRRDLPKWLVPLLRSLRKAAESIDKVIEKVEAQYEKNLQDERVVKLRTIEGVGPIAAMTLVATVDDPKRFRSSRCIGSYAGLVPSEYGTGEVFRRGHITKEGRAELRNVWIQVAHTVLRLKNHPLGAWGHRLVYRRGRKVAIVAVARRMLCIAFALLRDGTTFEAGRLKKVAA
jgi:transposase